MPTKAPPIPSGLLPTPIAINSPAYLPKTVCALVGVKEMNNMGSRKINFLSI
jgi:hypothetical protein